MIRTNLSTRPFYNERAVHFALGVLAAIVVALTVFNAGRIVTLTNQQRALSAKTAAEELKAEELRSAAARIRQGLNPQQLKVVSSSAAEANTIIDRRLFSWTELFNRLEATLPDDARILSVRPQIGKDGQVDLTMTVMARQTEDIDKFTENLEATGVFSHMLSGDDTPNEEGLIQANIQGVYAPTRSAPPPGGAVTPARP